MLRGGPPSGNNGGYAVFAHVIARTSNHNELGWQPLSISFLCQVPYKYIWRQMETVWSCSLVGEYILLPVLIIYIFGDIFPILCNWCFQLATRENSLDTRKHMIIFTVLRPRQNGRHFAGDISQCIFMNENFRISHRIPLKHVPYGLINNISALVQM